MGYTVKVEHPQFPEDTIFNVGGLDRVQNGGTLEVDEEMERLFMMEHGMTIEEAFANDAVVTATGSTALDQSEVDALLEVYAPQPEEEAPVQEEAPTGDVSSQSWTDTGTTGTTGTTDTTAEGGEASA